MGMAEQVLVVSIDGLAPRFITHRLMPNLCSLALSGASCFAARTVDPPLTVPAHASMFRGVAPDTHGLVDNTPIAPRTDAAVVVEGSLRAHDTDQLGTWWLRRADRQPCGGQWLSQPVGLRQCESLA